MENPIYTNYLNQYEQHFMGFNKLKNDEELLKFVNKYKVVVSCITGKNILVDLSVDTMRSFFNAYLTIQAYKEYNII